MLLLPQLVHHLRQRTASNNPRPRQVGVLAGPPASFRILIARRCALPGLLTLLCPFLSALRIPALAAMSAALRTNAQPSFSVPGQPSHVNPGTATPATAPGPAPGPLFQVFLAIWAPIRSVFFGGEDVVRGHCHQ